jgi:hypothetical protein
VDEVEVDPVEPHLELVERVQLRLLRAPVEAASPAVDQRRMNATFAPYRHPDSGISSGQRVRLSRSRRSSGTSSRTLRRSGSRLEGHQFVSAFHPIRDPAGRLNAGRRGYAENTQVVQRSTSPESGNKVDRPAGAPGGC